MARTTVCIGASNGSQLCSLNDLERLYTLSDRRLKQFKIDREEYEEWKQVPLNVVVYKTDGDDTIHLNPNCPVTGPDRPNRTQTPFATLENNLRCTVCGDMSYLQLDDEQYNSHVSMLLRTVTNKVVLTRQPLEKTQYETPLPAGRYPTLAALCASMENEYKITKDRARELKTIFLDRYLTKHIPVLGSRETRSYRYLQTRTVELLQGDKASEEESTAFIASVASLIHSLRTSQLVDLATDMGLNPQDLSIVDAQDQIAAKALEKVIEHKQTLLTYVNATKPQTYVTDTETILISRYAGGSFNRSQMVAALIKDGAIKRHMVHNTTLFYTAPVELELFLSSLFENDMYVTIDVPTDKIVETVNATQDSICDTVREVDLPTLAGMLTALQ